MEVSWLSLISNGLIAAFLIWRRRGRTDDVQHMPFQVLSQVRGRGCVASDSWPGLPTSWEMPAPHCFARVSAVAHPLPNSVRSALPRARARL